MLETLSDDDYVNVVYVSIQGSWQNVVFTQAIYRTNGMTVIFTHCNYRTNGMTVMFTHYNIGRMQ